MPIANSHEVIKRIASSLFSAEERRLELIKERLIVANKELHPGRPHDGFTYEGKTYDPVGLPLGRRTRVSLHVRLVGEMVEYLKDLEVVWGDRYYISQMLFLLLSPCSSLQDIRDALPNAIVDTLDDLKHLPRTRPDGYTIENSTRTIRQYRKAVTRMEFYATMRLMY